LTSSGVLYQPVMIDEVIIGGGKLRKLATLCSTSLIWTTLGLNSGLWGGKPAAQHLWRVPSSVQCWPITDRRYAGNSVCSYKSCVWRFIQVIRYGYILRLHRLADYITLISCVNPLSFSELSSSNLSSRTVAFPCILLCTS